MAVGKYSDVFLFSLFLCFSVLLRESYSKSIKDQKLSILDNTFDYEVDDILDKDSFDWEWPTISPDIFDREWPTFSPDIFDRHKPLENNISFFPGIYIFIITIVIFFFIIVCLCCIRCCFMKRESDDSGATIYAIVERPDSPHLPLPIISHSDNPHITIEFINPVDESYISTIDRPPRYDDIIRSELNGTESFPEVHPSIPDTPPPQYDDHNVPRY